MTQQEWENASEEERNAEIERCRTDAHYFYMTYYWKEGMKTYTKEEWDVMMKDVSIIGTRRMSRRRLVSELNELPKKFEEFAFKYPNI